MNICLNTDYRLEQHSEKEIRKSSLGVAASGLSFPRNCLQSLGSPFRSGSSLSCYEAHLKSLSCSRTFPCLFSTDQLCWHLTQIPSNGMRTCSISPNLDKEIQYQTASTLGNHSSLSRDTLHIYSLLNKCHTNYCGKRAEWLM